MPMNTLPTSVPQISPQSRDSSQTVESRLADKVRAEQVALLYNNTPSAMFANVTAIVLTSVVIWPTTSLTAFSVGLGALLAVNLFRFMQFMAYRRRIDCAQDAAIWERRAVTMAATTGLCWAGFGIFQTIQSEALQLSFIVFVLGGMIAGATSTLGAIRTAYLVFSLPIILAIVGSLLWRGDTISLAMAGLTTAFQVAMIGVVQRFSALFRRDIELRLNHDELVQSLTASTENLTRTNSELQTLNTKLEQAQSQLLQSEKMAAIGRLAAGVAHEINNPVGFIKSNLQTMGKYVADLMHVVNAYGKVEALLPEHQDSFTELHKLQEQIEFEYEKQDILALMSESREGLERVSKIVQDLKNFSHVESEDKWIVDDIHKEIESTLNVISNELRACEVKKDYGMLPPIEGLFSQLNQVFMNLLINAAHAIETRGTITIRTGTAVDMVWIEIADTGKGIASKSLSQIFVPFYTTKPVGQGTGLGLSVSYSIIQKHHGRITVESEVGKGTTFRIWLPIRRQRRVMKALRLSPLTILMDHILPFNLNNRIIIDPEKKTQSLWRSVFSRCGIELPQHDRY
jgi:signal transduction histidine kinase